MNNMDKSMFSEEYWNDIYQAIREEINEDGECDNIMSIKEDLDRRCVVISLYVGMMGDDEEETEYYKKLLSSFKSSMSTWELNPFKKYEYDDWFKGIVNQSEGIWIGGGVTQQFLIKLTIQLTSLSNITDDYGVYVKNGVPVIIKMVNEVK
jgi:S-DNA-T family DNA segregation ATPase FtsK/SpoIIIE